MIIIMQYCYRIQWSCCYIRYTSQFILSKPINNEKYITSLLQNHKSVSNHYLVHFLRGSDSLRLIFYYLIDINVWNSVILAEIWISLKSQNTGKYGVLGAR